MCFLCVAPIQYSPMATPVVSLQERYEASMVLSGAGDALAYNHGHWEFQRDGELIHQEVAKRGGLASLDAKDFPVSDDTVMHLATAEAMMEVGKKGKQTLARLVKHLVKEYIRCMRDMDGRAPGRRRNSGILCVFCFMFVVHPVVHIVVYKNGSIIVCF